MVDTAAISQAEGASSPSQKTGRKIAIVAGVVVVLLAGVLILVDWLARGVAESVVESELEQRMPETIDGDVDVSIGGFSMIAQYLAGRFDRIELDAPDLVVGDVPVSAHLVAESVPTDRSLPVGHMTGTVTVTQESLTSLIDLPGNASGLRLGEGTVSYQGEAAFFGIPVSYRLTAEPRPDGDSILLVPAGVEITAGGAALDLGGVVDELLGSAALPVCVASYLPDGVDVTGIEISPDEATVTFESTSLALDASAFATRGSC